MINYYSIKADIARLPLYRGLYKPSECYRSVKCTYFAQCIAILDSVYFIRCVGKRFYSSPLNSLGIRQSVDFKYLPFDSDFIKRLNACSIYNLYPFQYLIHQLLTGDVFTRKIINNNSKSRDLFFYNEKGSGKTVGYLLPLLNLYNQHMDFEAQTKTEHTTHGKNGRILIISNDTNASNGIASFIVSLKPFVKCVVLENPDLQAKKYTLSENGVNEVSKTESYVRALVRLNAMKLDSYYNILISSAGRMKEMLDDNLNGISKEVLASIDYIIFDDFHLPSNNGSKCDIYKRIRNAIKSAKNHLFKGCDLGLTSVYITDVLDSGLASYIKNMDSDVLVYDYKNGTRQRVVGGRHTDVIKLEIDLDISASIRSLDHETVDDKKMRGLEHCICKVAGQQNKLDRIVTLKNFVYSYLDLPLFSMAPYTTSPPSKFRCIVFVSNTSQKRRLATVEGFNSFAVYLGKDLNIFQRNEALENFKRGTKPIMIATDASVANCALEDVRFIFNFHPPRDVESYKSRAAFAATTPNAYCITLYDKSEYASLVNILKKMEKPVSIHLAPSATLMMKKSAQCLGNMVSQILAKCPSTIKLYVPKARQLLNDHGTGIMYSCMRRLVEILNPSMATAVSEDDESLDSQPLFTSSLLTGKPGFTAVLINDASGQTVASAEDVMQLLNYGQNKRCGKVLKTETGYIADVLNRYLSDLVQITNENPDVSIQMATSVPKILLDSDRKTTHQKASLSKLPWHSLKLRRIPQTKKRIII